MVRPIDPSDMPEQPERNESPADHNPFEELLPMCDRYIARLNLEAAGLKSAMFDVSSYDTDSFNLIPNCAMHTGYGCIRDTLVKLLDTQVEIARRDGKSITVIDIRRVSQAWLVGQIASRPELGRDIAQVQAFVINMLSAACFHLADNVLNGCMNPMCVANLLETIEFAMRVLEDDGIDCTCGDDFDHDEWMDPDSDFDEFQSG